ncbi:hypothetical protein [Pyramidobacter sp. C12-8]|uniref:hypothetical protein n=1 Tax=Pyramidobacter sp. C12-8 TaxID=1943580 RepID=UPI00099018ED|nr:hypothetical protein [Pyramidobacter sp. C12-8]OON89632.1 hypothetical protein B0D78_01995 [Pyramidobacter sp. C12-8]
MQFNPETMKIKICPDCKGMGSKDIPIFENGTKETAVCEHCGGTGRIVVETEVTKLSMPEMIRLEGTLEKGIHRPYICPYCRGLGNADMGYGGTCAECEGTGRMVKKVIATEFKLGDLDSIDQLNLALDPVSDAEDTDPEDFPEEMDPEDFPEEEDVDEVPAE